ncbi:hypothetical protein PHYSODRAFT_248063 [Phytophthora sojae]|uniref:Uncharacterized protein n=1 Tax=Phytophthora sojae (strain P6497) TaxID=1094619 RepID=G5AGQ7_PHYSP|nr:hypothetical protein PHYSODRAFT_248063 [Phytophthora sojae]EGZ05337.1 hypothetical protein PHYSODRAFT_248063 [Phytophthora sojae]|eukprot:XP_009539258.1 hypothetical protein PHYSODRAFT_248063 [Phytophthora sojae]
MPIRNLNVIRLNSISLCPGVSVCDPGYGYNGYGYNGYGYNGYGYNGYGYNDGIALAVAYPSNGGGATASASATANARKLHSVVTEPNPAQLAARSVETPKRVHVVAHLAVACVCAGHIYPSGQSLSRPLSVQGIIAYEF